MLEGLPPGVGSHGYESCVCVNICHAPPQGGRIMLDPWGPAWYVLTHILDTDVGPSRSHITTVDTHTRVLMLPPWVGA